MVWVNSLLLFTHYVQPMETNSQSVWETVYGVSKKHVFTKQCHRRKALTPSTDPFVFSYLVTVLQHRCLSFRGNKLRKRIGRIRGKYKACLRPLAHQTQAGRLMLFLTRDGRGRKKRRIDGVM